MKRILAMVAGGILLVAIALVLGWRESRTPIRDGDEATATAFPLLAPASSRPGGDVPMACAAAPAAALVATPALPPSLQGSEGDGGVTLDADGRLLPDLALRRLFDHYLSSIGELDIEQIRALLAARLDAITSAEGKRQALETFERYLRYLREIDAVSAQLSALPLRERLQRLTDLRRQLLGTDMAQAFFADEEAYQRYTLDRQDLAADTQLDASARAERERELLERLPPTVREPLQAQQRVETDLADANAIDDLAGDADERSRLRRERFGEEAAARMELLDRERAAWDARIAAYLSERERLQSLEAHTRRRALDEYLTRHFSETEQRRIRSLEAVDAL
ncbi:MAG: hypothetical protein IT479_04425 [Xanthomonadales bacterium]|nr:hypothetical protein [Xanthomonadales bacterium]